MFRWSRSGRPRAQGLLDMLGTFYCASCQPPNKQLERAVTPHQERAAGAPFHYAPTARWIARRAVAQLRRYAPH
jgi:hypothetical protein